MSTPQILTDEQAAAIWSGDTASILGYDNQEETTTVEETVTETTPAKTKLETQPEKKRIPVSDEEITNVWAGVDEDDEEDDNEDNESNPKPASPKSAPRGNEVTETEPRRGRKPTDLVTFVNQLVEEEVLSGYEEGDIKTIDEAKELIRENLRYREDTAFDKLWKKKVESYSPQVQAILDYADKGGHDISPLLSAISEVEKSSELSLNEETGQEEIVRQVLKIKGFDEEEIKDQIDTLKDLDKLKSKAQKFLPELNKMKEQRIQMMLEEQEDRDRQAREAASVYLQTITETLDKDQVGPVKLRREDKSKIFDALADAKFRSLNGFPVNEFVKTLEEMQFGKKADYQHFLNVVHFTVDKESFLEKIKESLKNEVTNDTVRRLKTSKTSSANSSTDLNPNDNPRKNVIQKSGFRNPYSK
jgi:hypothetical protein